MYYPPEFDRGRALELSLLIKQAYQQFAAFKQGTDWTLEGHYTKVGEVTYHTLVSFDVADEDDLTAVDKELQEEPVSFAPGSFLGQDIPMGFVATQADAVYLIFRGTVTLREWLFDANIHAQPYRLSQWGNVSNGFLKIYNRCRESVMNHLNGLEPERQFFIAGHSLGGALSLLAMPDVVQATAFKKPTVYTFGGPRVGDNDFVRAYNALPEQQTFRVVNTSDLVTAIPLPVVVPLLPSGNYSHVDTPVDFTYQGNSLTLNHTIDTYVAALGG